jgi:hypothetical protein
VRLGAALAAAVLSLAVAAGSELAGNLGRSSAEPPAVVRSSIDPVSGTIRALWIAGGNAMPGSPYLVSAESASAVWRAGRPAPDGTTPLTPEIGDPLVAEGESLTIRPVAADAAGRGATTLTAPPARVGAPRNLALAANFNDAAPFGWNVLGSPRFGRRPDANGTALTVALRGAQRDTWNVAGLEQRVDPAQTHFSIDLLPALPCDGENAHPRELSGVTLTASNGATLTFCVSSAIARERRVLLANGRQVVVVEPGRPGRWQRVKVDLSAGSAAGIDRAPGPLALFIGLRSNPAGNAADRNPLTIAFARASRR